MQCDEILPSLLGLPPEDRARLAQALLDSLEEPSSGSAEIEWIKEIERRVRELDSGQVQAVEWSIARERIARRLKERRATRNPSGR